MGTSTPYTTFAASATPEGSHISSSRQDQTSHLAQEDLSPEDTFVLFAVLQEIANELRRIKQDKQQTMARCPDEVRCISSSIEEDQR